ncbi:MAG: thioredoxin [Oscillibacter sp.]|nr:thioredoxin [Oscillibacter sp.]
MSVKHLTTAEFDAVVDNAPLTLVDFWATWCGPCRMVGPVIEKLGEKYQDTAVIAKVDVDAEPDLARRFGIMSIPTVVFLKNGKEFERLVGVQNPQVYMDILDKNL